MTEKQWDKIKQKAIDKWTEGIEQTTKSNYLNWVIHSGSKSCSFCRSFGVINIYFVVCRECPLDDKTKIKCAIEWQKVCDAKTYETFIKYATKLLERIEAIEYNPKWKSIHREEK